MIRTFIDLDAVGRDAHDHLTVWSHITADIRTVLLKNHMRPRIASLDHIDAVRIGFDGIADASFLALQDLIIDDIMLAILK